MSPVLHHPFAVSACLKTSLVLSFAAPIARVRQMLPPQLSPDSFDDTHGYLAAAIVHTTGLRPAGFPRFTGQDFMLIGYRIFVRLKTAAGRRLRGLYILRSETDSYQMALLGNALSSYRYARTAIRLEEGPAQIRVTSGLSMDLVADLSAKPALPAGSPFANWQAARRFAGPMPFTFSTMAGSSDIVVVEGVRERWNPQPVAIREARIPFFETLLQHNFQLANAFLLRDIPYHWKKARRIQCIQNEAGFRD